MVQTVLLEEHLLRVAHRYRFKIFQGEKQDAWRQWLSLGFRVAGLIASVGVGSACAELRVEKCAPCEAECPGNLYCDQTILRCVEPGETCDIPSSSTATTTSTLSGEGGGAGDDGDSSTKGDSGRTDLTSETSTGGASTGGASTGGASTGGLGSGGTGGGSGSPASSSTGDGSGGTASHACDDGGCDARILTSILGPFCAGAEIEVQLEAICSCDSEEARDMRSFRWSFEDPPGLTLELTTAGVLSGTLAPGTHRFNVAATTNSGAVRVSGEVVLEVVDRCLVIFRSDEATPGDPYLVASRLDTAQATNVPLIGGDDASVSSFDVAPDGRYLAQIEDTAAERKLQLFDLLDNQVVHLADVHVDQYLAHAFSPDSHWLAVVEGPPDDPAAANLKVIDLHAEPAQVLDEYGIHYLGGLTWSTADHIIYVSPSTMLFSSTHEIVVDETELSSPVDYTSTWNIWEFDPFVGYFVGEHGFLQVYNGQRCFFDRDTGECREFPAFGALSPSLTWGAFPVADSAVDLFLLSEVYTEDAPQASIEGCEIVRAWAEDDSTLLCTRNLKPVVYEVESDGTLTETPLDLTGALSLDKRVAFSRTGDWLALTPQEDGLVVLPREEFETRSLDDVMLSQVANESWDFFFTSDAGRLIVQRGTELFVAHLDAENLPPEFVRVATDLAPRPECLITDWFVDPPTWCGAPQFRGNLVLSPEEKHLGFVNDGQVTSIALTRGDYPLKTHGTLAPGCGSECIRFR